LLFAKMAQQEDCLVVFESIPLIYGSEAIKFLRPPLGWSICLWKIGTLH